MGMSVQVDTSASATHNEWHQTTFYQQTALILKIIFCKVKDEKGLWYDMGVLSAH